MNTAATFVIDTNIILDCFVFFDPSTLSLRQSLQTSQYSWIATPEMEKEYLRVLTYAPIERITRTFTNRQRLALHAIFEKYATQVSPAPSATQARCKDPDDQKFIDLAVAHQCQLLSKDKAVLKLRSQLLSHGVIVKHP